MPKLFLGISLISIVIVVLIFAAFIASFFMGFLFDHNFRMLTKVPGFFGREWVTPSIWTGFALSIGCSFILESWVKRLHCVVLLTIGIPFFLMPIMVLAQDYTESALFSVGHSSYSVETFRVIDAEHSSYRGSSWDSISAYIPRYNAAPNIPVDRDTYTFVEKSLLTMPGDAWMYWPSKRTSEYCIKLKVEKNGRNARVLFDREMKMADLFSCPMDKQLLRGYRKG